VWIALACAASAVAALVRSAARTVAALAAAVLAGVAAASVLAAGLLSGRDVTGPGVDAMTLAAVVSTVAAVVLLPRRRIGPLVATGAVLAVSVGAAFVFGVVTDHPEIQVIR
jgi:hypothetical protein